MEPDDIERDESALEPGEDLDPNKMIGIKGYELVRELNSGGQAVVFLAIQRSTGRKVAIKILIEGPLHTSNDRNRMENEVRILASLDHPNIVSVIDRGETREGWPYFVLEYVQGQVLAEFIDQWRENHPPLGAPGELANILRLFSKVCDAVNAAHLRGIVHRDLKPSNIIVDPYGEPHILDFGVARAPSAWLGPRERIDPDTMTGEFLGSLQWASPEQTEGERDKIDIRTDVYSLGVMLYEILTGAFPYDVFGKIRDVLENIATTKPVAPSVALEEILAKNARDKQKTSKRSKTLIDSALDAIVLKALSKNKTSRYQSAGELAKDIVNYLDGKRVSAPRHTSPVALWVAGLAIVAAAVIGLVALKSGEQAAVTATAIEEINQSDNVFGYRIEGDSIVFEFDAREFNVARMSDGALGDVSWVAAIESVAVAGPFNDWMYEDSDWVMEKVGRKLFRMAKPISLFKARAEWPFKFVINGNVWVGAPELAENKMVVAEDTATYNLLLINPKSDADGAEFKAYRRQINRAWPGQGQNLALAQDGGLHLSLTQTREGVRIRDLEPLKDIPLTTLNLGDAKIHDFSALKGMATLKTLVCVDETYYGLMWEVIQALERNDVEAAAQEAERLLTGLDDVPALAEFTTLVRNSTIAMTALNENPEEIPDGAAVFKGRHYTIVLTPLTWQQASDFAASFGAHLATVTSEEEQAWLTKTFGRPTMGRTMWLGGTDEQVEGRWGWITGEPWVYDNWTPPEPNNDGGVEHYLAMKSDSWWIDAQGESTRLPFIIEWDR